jgi:hypothetical protein
MNKILDKGLFTLAKFAAKTARKTTRDSSRVYLPWPPWSMQHEKKQTY